MCAINIWADWAKGQSIMQFFFLYVIHTDCHPAFSVPAVMSRTHEVPGEMGKAVIVPKEDQDKMKELFKINQFNLMASDMIALNRSLPDVRLDG